MKELERLRLVYAELRKHLGEGVSARQILDYSLALIEFVRETNEDFHVDQESHQRIFANWAVDLAMADEAGWRVLAHELGICPGIWPDDDQLTLATLVAKERGRFQMSCIKLGESRSPSGFSSVPSSPMLASPERSLANPEWQSEEDL